MELKEVELKKVDDLMFKRIGLDVPMLEDSQGFSSDQLPFRALAVSNRFGYCLYAHSEGFSVAKTSDLIEIAEKPKDKSKTPQTAQEKSIATVSGDSIRFVSLSCDELTVAVGLGGTLKFYDLPTLVRKSDTRPFEARKVDPVEDTHVKDFLWSPTDTDAYLIVTNNQELLLGCCGSAPEVKVEKGVLAASWSEDGKHVAYVSESRQLSITTSTFTKFFNIELPVHLSDEDVESNFNVDAIRWVRPDSIMIAYVRVNSEGEEDGYPLFVVTSASGNLAEEQSETLGLFFYQLFPSIDSFVTPPGSGPYMLLDYLKPWEMVVAASRKSIDDHIVLVGWLPENGKDEAYSLELGNDLWLPRIELQENGDDNAIVGLGIDRTTVQIQLTDPKDDSGESKLPPCPVLICVTVEGKLSFFSFARLDGKQQIPNLVSAPSNLPESKRSLTQVSQVTGKSSNATPVPTKKALDAPERQSAANQGDVLEKKEEEMSSQSAGLRSKSKEDGKDSTVSLHERFSRPSPSLQPVPPEKPDNGPKWGLTTGSSQSSALSEVDGPKQSPISGSQDSKLPSLKYGPSLAQRDTEVENMSKPYQGLFRPLEDASKSVSSTAYANFPPAFSFNDSNRSGSLKMASFQNPAIAGPSAAFGTSSQLGVVFSKGDDKIAATRPVSPQPQKASHFMAAAPSFSFSSASVGKGFQVGANAFPSGQHQQSQGRATGVSDMEATFITELEKVKKMAEEVDQLMSYIEGRATTDSFESNATFTRQSLEELEQGIHLLSEDCKAHRRQLTQEKQNVEDFRDESLRVDAWRIYARSIMEQKSDSRHQELWTLQKLHPELDTKRRRVLKADQDLKLKIAEMEKHLHSLELKQWQADNARRRPNKHVRNPGQFLSAQNLYNTVNAQLAVADDISLSLTQQMEALNLEWSSPAKGSKKSTAASILKYVGAQPEDVRHTYTEPNGQSPIPRHRLSYSPVPRAALSVDPIASPAGQFPCLCDYTQETTRRRRDSMDAAWVESGAPKTTIKRPVHSKQSQRFASVNSSLPSFRQGKGIVAEVSARESLSQSRHARQTQSITMATQSTNLSFSSQGFETAVSVPPYGRVATSGPQWPFALQDQQRRSSSTPLNGEFGVAHSTPFGSSSSVGNAESKESLFKWANSSTSGSKVTPIVPAHPFVPFGKQGDVGTFVGSSSGISGKMSSTLVSKQSPSGSADGTAGSVKGTLDSVPATNPSLLVAFDGGGGDITGKSGGFTKGTIQGSKFGTVSSLGNQMDRSRLDRETNQNQGGTSSVGSAPLMTGPAPSSILTGPKPTLVTAPSLLALSGSTSESWASAGTSQSLQSAVRSVETTEPDWRTDTGNESQSGLKQSTVTNFPAHPQLSAPGSQKTAKEQASIQAKEPAKRLDEVKGDTNPQSASFAAVGSSAKSLFDFSSKPVSTGPGSSPLAAMVSLSPGFTYATASAPSSQSQVSKSLFATGMNARIEATSPLLTSSTSSSFGNVSGSASSVSMIGAAATSSQSPSLPSSTTVDKSDLKTLTPTGASLLSSPAATPPSKFGVQGNTSKPPNLFSVPNTGLMSGTAGGQAPSTSAILSDAGKSFLASARSAAAPIQSAGSPFTSSSIPTTVQSGSSTFTLPSASASSGTITPPFATSSISNFSTAGTQMTSSPFGQSSSWGSSGQQPFMFPNSSSVAATPSITPAGLADNEDDMEEEASTGANTASIGGFGGFGGLGLGSSNTPTQIAKSNPFGGSLFGSSPAPTLNAPSSGQLFRPATFSLPAAQSSSPTQSGGSSFGSAFGSSGFPQNNLFSSTDAGKPFGSSSQASPGGFGQPAQLGPAQQVLGSALGAFGQTRQMGFGTPSFGSAGFAVAPQGGGFANAATGGGFASAATGGGFASAATGGGFAGAATGGGFAGAVTTGGFTGSPGGAFGSSSGGGFQGFGGTQASQPFGGGIQASLFTQMRK